MKVDVRVLFEILFVVLTLKLMVSRWKPPLQESAQAIICITLGSILGFVANPTKEGFILGIVTSGIAFYGKDLIENVKTIREDLKELN